MLGVGNVMVWLGVTSRSRSLTSLDFNFGYSLSQGCKSGFFMGGGGIIFCKYESILQSTQVVKMFVSNNY